MGAPPGSPPTTPASPVTESLRPIQVVLSVGAVLVVAAGADLAAQYGGTPARVLLLALAAGATALSLRAIRGGLRNSAETFAACAVGLSLAGAQFGSIFRIAVPLTLAVASLVLHRFARPSSSGPWPRGSTGRSPRSGRSHRSPSPCTPPCISGSLSSA